MAETTPIPPRESFLTKKHRAIDIEKPITIGPLVEQFRHAGFQARALAECRDVWRNMLEDPERPTIILGIAASQIAAGNRKVIRDMVKHGLVDCIAMTGAIAYQDYYQAKGNSYYQGEITADDVVLREHYLNRYYDTYADEKLFEDTDRHIAKVFGKLEPRDYSSREILSLLGKDAANEDSILYQAYKNGIPIFSPALCDSSIGIGMTVFYAQNAKKKWTERPTLDMIRDNYEMLQIIYKSKKTAAIYIGGGTPKNWVNDSVVMANYTSERELEGHAYIFQITTDSPQWGSLSGSTLQEAQSWGKVSAKATKAQAYVEASIALPLLTGAMMEEKTLLSKRTRLQYNWQGNELKNISIK